MPRLIDWSARFECMREAIVRIAARDGARGVTLQAVAAELELSPSTLRRTLISPDVLRAMGVEWIARERRYPRYRLPDGVERGSVDHVTWSLGIEVPTDEAALVRERAWRELTVIGCDAESLELCAAHDAYLDALVRKAVAVARVGSGAGVGVGSGDEESGSGDEVSPLEVVRLRALIDGLTHAACRGAVTRDQVLAAISEHLSELGRRAPQTTLSPDAA